MENLCIKKENKGHTDSINNHSPGETDKRTEKILYIYSLHGEYIGERVMNTVRVKMSKVTKEETMKQQLGFFILLSLLCCGILLFPYRVESKEKEEIREERPVDKGICVQVLHGDTVETMTLFEYLVGVVSGEMAEEFPLEAQKAQAVAARTFALRQAGEKKHEGADVCTDSSCCQAWSQISYPGAVSAVEETDGLVLIHGEELIEATYFSCSGGRTESAVAVWGNDIPYLQSVDSPGEEEAPRFREEIEITAESFLARLQTVHPELAPVGEAPQWFGEISYTNGNGIDYVEICGEPFQGTQLRKLFGLRSTNIRFSVRESAITISTCGYGHRVGMSQYGAVAMAEEGRSFTDILSHYYQNTEIKRLSLPGEA